MERKIIKTHEPIAIIELGLNMLAQDLIWKTHTDKDIDYYLKMFVFMGKKI